MKYGIDTAVSFDFDLGGNSAELINLTQKIPLS